MQIIKQEGTIFNPEPSIKLALDENDQKFGLLGQLFNAYMLAWDQASKATGQRVETPIHPTLSLASEQWQHASTRPGIIKGIIREFDKDGRKVLCPNLLAFGHEVWHEVCSQYAQDNNLYTKEGAIDWDRMPYLDPDEVANVGKG